MWNGDRSSNDITIRLDAMVPQRSTTAAYDYMLLKHCFIACTRFILLFTIKTLCMFSANVITLFEMPEENCTLFSYLITFGDSFTSKQPTTAQVVVVTWIEKSKQFFDNCLEYTLFTRRREKKVKTSSKVDIERQFWWFCCEQINFIPK